MALARPRDLIFTLLGDYLLHREGPVWVGSLLELLEPLGLSRSAARTALSRMSRREWFTTERRGRRSYYDLTPKSRKLLEEGEERIYHPPRDRAEHDGWLLLAYSVPEDERKLRDRLRDRLLWLGFGSLGNGLWISPHPVEEEIRDVAGSLGVTEYIETFRAEHLGFSNPAGLVEKCWDLPDLNARYRSFIDRHLSDFRAFRDALAEGKEISREKCFVRRFRLIHDYREFPLMDPYLPRDLLPDDWAGECASEFFETYHDLLGGPANDYVESVIEFPERAGDEDIA